MLDPRQQLAAFLFREAIRTRPRPAEDPGKRRIDRSEDT
jgi:hypothetical protein